MWWKRTSLLDGGGFYRSRDYDQWPNGRTELSILRRVPRAHAGGGIARAPCSTSDRRLEYLLTRRED